MKIDEVCSRHSNVYIKTTGDDIIERYLDDDLDETLIVDDELFNLQAMMIVLKAAAAKLGYSPEYIDQIVDQELSGKEALRQVQNNKYKLIITDLSMPGMDGYTTTKKIRQYFAEKRFA